jgi:predicted transcriptional regulator
MELEEALGLKQLRIEPQKTIIPQPLSPNQLKTELHSTKMVELMLDGYTMDEIATQIGVHRSTLYEYFDTWTKTGQAREIELEWLTQYAKMKKRNPTEAFRNLTKVYAKIKEKQTKVEVNVQNTSFQVDISQQVQSLIKIAGDTTSPPPTKQTLLF